jgi:predicted dehydrogenase
MVGDFVEAVASGKECRPNFEDGACIQRILDAALRSSSEGRKVAIEEIS